MILIIAKSKVKEGKREAFYNMAKELEAESRKEPGCISYTLYEDIHDPLQFCYVEAWKDQEAISIHNQSPHFTRLVPLMNEIKAASDVTHYKVCE